MTDRDIIAGATGFAEAPEFVDPSHLTTVIDVLETERTDLLSRIEALEAELARVKGGRDEAINRLKFTHPVFNNASKGPVSMEADESLPGARKDVYRIVRDEDARRFREDYKTTARPPYIATVYSFDDAVLVTFAFNEYENTLRALVQVTEKRDAAIARAEKAEQERDEEKRANDAWLAMAQLDAGGAFVAWKRRPDIERNTAEQIAGFVRSDPHHASDLTDPACPIGTALTKLAISIYEGAWKPAPSGGVESK